MVTLLKYYIGSQAYKGEAARKFFDTCDKYLGKHAESLEALELAFLVRLYDM